MPESLFYKVAGQIFKSIFFTEHIWTTASGIQQVMAGFSSILKIITAYDYLYFRKFTDYIVLLKTETKTERKTSKN